MRILFVDDLSDTRDVFRIAFGLQGHSTRLAGNGTEAVDAVREEKFDAIIIDVEMPEMNGWDAVQEIRQLDNGRNVPIVMFTAYGNGDNERKAHAAGANGLVQKPISPPELISEVARFRQAA
ncbi:MAG TPA: response regulator [Abditibacteriaceae bacterium]|nr:response regulator [Abditibacteriaceae bacterium]